MLIEMFRVRFWITLTVTALSLSPGVLSADDQAIQKAEKAVRLVWFPRFSPDGKWLITAHGSWDENEGGEVRVWEAETGKPRFVVPTERCADCRVGAEWEIFRVGRLRGKHLLLRCRDGEADRSDKTSRQCRGAAEFLPTENVSLPPLETVPFGCGKSPRKTRFTPGRCFIGEASGGWPCPPTARCSPPRGKIISARLLDTENFKVLHEFQHPTDVNGVVFSNDNKTLLTGCGDAAIRVFDVASSKEIRELEGHTIGSVTDLEFSPDGKVLASGGMDRTVRIWDLVDFERPKLKSTVGGFNDMVFGVAISPNGKWLAAVGWDDQIKLLDLSTVEEKWSWKR